MDFLVPFSLLCLVLLRFAMLAYVQVGSAFGTLQNSPYLSGCYPVFFAMLIMGGAISGKVQKCMDTIVVTQRKDDIVVK